MKLHKILTLSAIPLALSAIQANAGLINVIDRSSSLVASVSNYEENNGQYDSQQSTDITAFNENFELFTTQAIPEHCGCIQSVSASQNSYFTNNSIHYQDYLQHASGGSYIGGFSAKSVFSVTFEVTSSSNFNLDWSADSDWKWTLSSSRDLAYQKVSLIKQGDNTTAFSLNGWFNSFSPPYDGPTGTMTPGCTLEFPCWDINPRTGSLSGLLEAGIYTLIISDEIKPQSTLQDGYSTFSYINFDLALTPVPVPATAWLLGSGLIGLAGVARKRRAS